MQARRDSRDMHGSEGTRRWRMLPCAPILLLNARGLFETLDDWKAPRQMQRGSPSVNGFPETCQIDSHLLWVRVLYVLTFVDNLGRHRYQRCPPVAPVAFVGSTQCAGSMLTGERDLMRTIPPFFS